MGLLIWDFPTLNGPVGMTDQPDPDERAANAFELSEEIGRVRFRAELGRLAGTSGLTNLWHFYESTDRALALLAEHEDDHSERIMFESHRARILAPTFLMTCAHVEERFHALGDRPFFEGEAGYSAGLERFKPILRNYVDLGAAPWWGELLKLYSVRHCLIHANSRVSILRPSDQEVVRTFVDESLLEYHENKDRISLTREFLLRAMRTVWDAVHDLADASGSIPDADGG